MYSMSTPLTSDEVDAASAIVRVQRPLHWTLARRLLAEVVRLRAALAVREAPAAMTADQDEPSSAPTTLVHVDEGPR